MSWRVVVVSGICKLEYKLGYLVCRGEETRRVYISEISTLVIESTAVSLTSALLCELIKSKVNIVFCDEKHNPHSQLNALYGRHDCSGILRKQLSWREETKNAVWAEIVRLKIAGQYSFLRDLDSEQAVLLETYLGDIRGADLTNREGHAAKVYFNVLFGLDFRRGDDTFINGALNYGYAIILSAFNREIVACGYNTQLGLSHKSEFNSYNLACDLMEPFRVLVDRYVFCSAEEMTPEYKHSLCDILNRQVRISGANSTVSSAIGIYCKSVFTALETGDTSVIKCYEL